MHEHGTQSALGEDLLTEVWDGLNREQKELSPRLFYDRRGSELFDEITRLPEYYPTRLERMLLETHVARWMRDRSPAPRSLIELGAGSADKTRVLLDTMPADAWYVPIDISATYLEAVASATAVQYPHMTIVPIESDISGGPVVAGEVPRPAVIAFLGSTIGNFESAAAATLLAGVRSVMLPGDRFIMGADLVKDVRVLERAYNDTRGVTARFNLNILNVLNRELDTAFQPDMFEHLAFYNEEQSRIEMHLVSRVAQSVELPGAGTISFRAGETIRTEVSCKHSRRSVERLFAPAGLSIDEWITDASDWYALAIGRIER